MYNLVQILAVHIFKIVFFCKFRWCFFTHCTYTKRPWDILSLTHAHHGTLLSIHCHRAARAVRAPRFFREKELIMRLDCICPETSFFFFKDLNARFFQKRSEYAFRSSHPPMSATQVRIHRARAQGFWVLDLLSFAKARARFLPLALRAPELTLFHSVHFPAQKNRLVRNV